MRRTAREWILELFYWVSRRTHSLSAKTPSFPAKNRADRSRRCFLFHSFLIQEYIGKASFGLLHGVAIYSSRYSCTHLTVDLSVLLTLDLSVSQWQSVLVVRFFARSAWSAGCCVASVGKVGKGSDSCGCSGCDNVNTLERTRHPECTCTRANPSPSYGDPTETLRPRVPQCLCASRILCLFRCGCLYVSPTVWLELSGCHGNERPCPSLCLRGSWGLWGFRDHSP